MTFHWPHVLWCLVLPIALAIGELRRRAARAHSAHPKMLRAEAGSQSLTLVGLRHENLNTGMPRFRWRAWGALALAIVALARPQWGRLDEPVFDQSREIIIAVDLSRSMLTPDVPPSRLDRAKLLVASLLERLKGERVGLIVFSGTAFLQSPLSSDYEVLNEFLPNLNPDYLPEGGTNYQALIETALSAFGENTSSDRYLIVLSDGEATDDNWKSAAEKLKASGVKVVALGVGTPAGAIIPDGHGGFVKDERGAVVLSKLEPATLQSLASMTHGVYRDASSWIDLAQLIESTVDTGTKGKFREEKQVRLAERFEWALIPACILFLWSFSHEFPVRPRPRDLQLAGYVAPAASASPPPIHVALWMLAGLGLMFTAAPRARSAVQPSPPAPANAEPEPTPAASPADPLSKLVQDFSHRDSLSARDYAEVAQETVTYGERMKTSQQPPNEGAVRDGLAAVDAGEAEDPHAADWDKLRGQLKKLLEKPEPTPTPPKSQDQKNQQNQDSKKNDDSKSQQNQSKDSKDNKSSDKNQSDQQKQSDQQNQPTPQNQSQNNSQNGSQSQNSNSASPTPQPKPLSKSLGEMQAPSPMPGQKNSATPETQKVGGAPEKTEQAPQDPALALPMQRLDQVRNQDSPAELQALMREARPTPTPGGKNW